jgi:hypothetical protein
MAIKQQLAAACKLAGNLGMIAAKYQLAEAASVVCGCVKLPLECGQALLALMAVSGSESTWDREAILESQTMLLSVMVNLAIVQHHTFARHFAVHLAAPEPLLAWLSAAASATLARRLYLRGGWFAVLFLHLRSAQPSWLRVFVR